MSSQSGIVANEQLTAEFNSFISNQNRALIIKIENENIVPFKTLSGSSDFKRDFDEITAQFSQQENDPAYLVIKNDENAANTNYIFVSYVPEFAAVRAKMIYASSKTNLLNTLGSARFKYSLFLTNLAELTYTGWRDYLKHDGLENPLTAEERSLLEIKSLENQEVLASSSQLKQKLANINESRDLRLHLSEQLQSQLNGLSSAVSGRLIIAAIENETVQLNNTFDSVSPTQLPAKIDGHDSPRYSIYKYGSNKLAFVYSCPSGSKVKQRMIYASTKAGFLNQLSNEFGLAFDAKIEVGDADEIEVSEFEEKEETEESTKSLRVSRPKGPRRR